ncbi:MAG TPA: excinuclease ABC subunit UvrA [Cyclobacteriaceae bacterium]
MNNNNLSIEDRDPRHNIIIKGAKVNNLKNLDVVIPRNKLVVITGLSGSGKSSLAFDTLFAEGQRKYVESLSSYVRQFMDRMEKPEVDYIKGVSPAIAIEQKVNIKNPRSTVGTTTEIYDYLKLLFARIGETYSPLSGKIVKKDTVSDVVNWLFSYPENTKAIIRCPLLKQNGRSITEELKILLAKGYTRIYLNDELLEIEDHIENNALKNVRIDILIDRVTAKKDEENQYRISDSIETAFFEGHGECEIVIPGKISRHFSDRFEADGIEFEVPTLNFFSFNNSYGACRRCEGFGKILGIDPDLVIPDKNLSVYEGAIAPWKSDTMYAWLEPLIKNGIRFDFPIHKPFKDLSEEQKTLLWEGNEYFKGIKAFFKYLEKKSHKIQYRVLISRYRGRTVCPECKGTRLRRDASYVKIDGKSIIDLVLMPIRVLSDFIDNLNIEPYQVEVSKRIIDEIKNRLYFLQNVGLGYLTLNRLTSSLSGGEYQRIKLATSLGSSLVGSMYILDEPSIGLHPRDTGRLVNVLKKLQKIGNTVIVVEHEEEVMKAADQIIDIGPGAGTNGGQLVFQGDWNAIREERKSYTARYLNKKDEIGLPIKRRKWINSIKIKGANENNLKNIDVEIPLGVLSVITGVSGSGKSTLVRKIIHPAIGKILGTIYESTGKFDKLEGDYKKISHIEMVNQNPIGKSSRSNPVTYVKAYDLIRNLFANQELAKNRGYKPAFFSFNVDGGRCEVCNGEGETKIEMQFMADLYLTCESCSGSRFKSEILEVSYNSKNIADVLNMTVEDSMKFFAGEKSIINKLRPLYDVGLGYITLGQSSNSLSGGEAQRVKLASFLGHASPKKDHTLFIFDEPTTGLHFHDINKLLKAINALIDQGNSVIIIEHNMEIIKCADWIIDLGPEGGLEGGEVCFTGTPEAMIKMKNNYTAQYLQQKL